MVYHWNLHISTTQLLHQVCSTKIHKCILVDSLALERRLFSHTFFRGSWCFGPGLGPVPAGASSRPPAAGRPHLAVHRPSGAMGPMGPMALWAPWAPMTLRHHGHHGHHGHLWHHGHHGNHGYHGPPEGIEPRNKNAAKMCGGNQPKLIVTV